MRNLLSRLVSRPDPTPPTNHHPLRHRSPLQPWQIRERCFTVRRRGLDPDEIRTFLHRVADELTVAQTAVVAVQEENVRIKNALRAWQSAQSAHHQYR
ncbi:DivIVA domain-containing protein [Micromonospora sp. NPDC000089]|uniref:DivIVA domain-containing protein n=1 Tax=unclassified Micromonospora TaxID=2617518 RepID=UPI0036D195F5